MNPVKKTILTVVLFLVANFLLYLLHRALFNSIFPFGGWLSSLIHLVILILIPYGKIINRINNKLLLLMLCGLASLSSCSRVEPNYEGVLMENYGRNGEQDFQSVTGSQNTFSPGTELYQVPMFEQKADPQQIGVTAKDGGYFSVDPTFTYQAIRGKGVKIIFNYKHVGVNGSDMMDNIENNILNPIVLNAYKEEARNFTTDSLLNNLGKFEQQVENRLKQEFEAKFFVINSLTSGLKPPQSMIEAIERRNNAIQQAEQVKNELAVARMNLEKAKIDAEANRVRTSGLSSMNLTEKWIEAIRNTNNKVIITDGKTPVLLN